MEVRYEDKILSLREGYGMDFRGFVGLLLVLKWRQKQRVEQGKIVQLDLRKLQDCSLSQGEGQGQVKGDSYSFNYYVRDIFEGIRGVLDV